MYNGIAIVEDNDKLFRPKYRSISLDDIKIIGKLMATRFLSESEACITLGIRPSAWYKWKQRNGRNEYLKSLIDKIRGTQTAKLIDKIESASDDKELMIGDKIVQRRGDWRAAAWLAERTKPELAGKSDSSPQPTTNINVLMIHDSIKRIFNEPEQEPEIKLINDEHKIKSIPPRKHTQM